MPKADRNAEITWKGSLLQGAGTITRTGSGAFSNLPITWAARTESSDGKTSPEELLAAAHASCFSMQFASVLSKAGHTPEELNVSATCTFEPPKITTMILEVRGRVPELDQKEFQRLADDAGEKCPVSNALRNNLDIQVDARLES